MPLIPTLAEILDDHRDAILGELHVAMPGRIHTYDATKQVADVVPCVRGTIPDRDGYTLLEDLPVIPNVPVSWPRGGGYYIHFPLKSDLVDGTGNGDHVWLVFNSAAIAQWRATGEVSEPGDLRRSTLSYPFAIPGAAPDKGAFTGAPASGVAVIGVPTGGVLRVGGASADYVALAAYVDARLAAIQSAFDAHTHTVAIPSTGAAGALSTGTAAQPASPVGALATVAATKLKAE